MGKITCEDLEQELRRNYWTVSLAMRLLSSDVGSRSEGQSVAEALHEYRAPGESGNKKERPHKLQLAIDRIDQAKLRILWDDTTHSRPPRDDKTGPTDGAAEYRKEYFIEWALGIRHRIPWYDLAVKTGFIPALDEHEVKPASDLSGRENDKPVHNRKKDIYLKVIVALLIKQGIDITDEKAKPHLKIKKIIEDAGYTIKGSTAQQLFVDMVESPDLQRVVAELRNLKSAK